MVEAGRGVVLPSVYVSPQSSQAGRLRNIQSVFSGMFHRPVQLKTKWRPCTLGGERGSAPSQTRIHLALGHWRLEQFLGSD